MTTTSELLAPKVARVPESETTYRLVRHLEPDEAARITSQNRERNFRPGEMATMSISSTLGVVAFLGSAMFLAGSYNTSLLAAPLLLQLALFGAALYGTRRLFALVVGRSKAGAYYAGGDFRRHLTATDVAVAMAVLVLGVPHLALTPVVQAAAVAGALSMLLVVQRSSVRTLRARLDAEEVAEQQAQLGVSE